MSDDTTQPPAGHDRRQRLAGERLRRHEERKEERGASAGPPGRPVESAITAFLQAFEVAMWAEGIDPEAALRVLNRVTFGHPAGYDAGNTIISVPWWAEDIARSHCGLMRHQLLKRREALPDDIAGPFDSQVIENDLRQVVLALVRQMLQDIPAPIEQALAVPGERKETQDAD